MAKKVVVHSEEWSQSSNSFSYCRALEEGNILLFQTIPFSFPHEEIDFLLAQRQGSSRARKNIAYKPQEDRITNHECREPKTQERLREILRNYSHRVTSFLSDLLPSYKEHWKLDFASFRPFQEKGRKLRTRARNDLLHVDAFPTRPLHGARILRFFTNINPVESRHWLTSLSFQELARRFAGMHGVRFPRTAKYAWRECIERKGKEWLRKLGLKLPLRSPYDTFMLKMHHFLKENEQFQQECPKEHWNFAPHSCWAVFTDQVSHAALAGQYALEQTLLIPRQALLRPELSPVHVLERLSQKNMVVPEWGETHFSLRG